MKAFKKLTTVVILSLVTTKLFSGNHTDNPEVVYKPKQVLKIMKKVADWQLNNWEEKGYEWPKWDWTNATAYTGLFELGNISSKKYHNSLIAIGNELNWNTGPNRFYADDYCIAQTYTNLYIKYKEDKMIAKFKLLADSIVNQPHTESLEWKNEINHREWAWCDALFMGPPPLSYLATATSERKYLDISDKLFWKTYDYLYDKEEFLFYRDGSNFTKKEKNGKKVFWSRGNGWVMAGLVRVIDNLPQDYPSRDRYIKLYKEMSAKMASIQQPDGSWHTSLLDPKSYPLKETSGTAFYTYALLWGLNNGILDKETYWPVVKKSWSALATAVQPDGLLGYVQPIGWQPAPASKNSTASFGTGAFLLAGSEIYKYIKNN
jgi:rhamnogalacturonyl hydrolase YesR